MLTCSFQDTILSSIDNMWCEQSISMRRKADRVYEEEKWKLWGWMCIFLLFFNTMAAFIYKAIFGDLIHEVACYFKIRYSRGPEGLFIIGTDWLTSSVHLWHHLGSLYILGPSSAGTAASSLVDHQTTSIHQHKSAQRGANCIRRPSLFLSGLCVCLCVGKGMSGWVELRGEERGEDW